MSIMLSALLAAASPTGPKRHSTDVSSPSNDDLTQKFADALRAAIPKSHHLRAWSGDDPDDLTLAILFQVQPHGKHFAYAVDLLRATGDPTPDRVDSFTGNCNEKAIPACALGVVRKADGKVKD